MKELADVPETHAGKDFADGLIFRDQFRSIFVDHCQFEYDEKGHGGPDRSVTNSEAIKALSK